MMNADLSSIIESSLLVGFLATLISLIPAIGLGWILARSDFRLKALLNLVIFFPMVSPPVVTGFVLLKILGRNSVIGQGLGLMGVTIPFTLTGAVIASALVSFPLFVMMVRASFSSLDRSLEEYSLTAGYSPWKTFLKISLPLSWPGILAGAVICFARSLGEFGATIVLAGDIEGKTRTISMAIYSLLDSPTGESQAAKLLGYSLAFSLTGLAVYEFLNHRFWKRLE